jgi:hypothetical protein
MIGHDGILLRMNVLRANNWWWLSLKERAAG